jgi:ferritin
MADEEREHANKFMEYQNKRGGTIVLLDVKVCSYFLFFLLYIKNNDF